MAKEHFSTLSDLVEGFYFALQSEGRSKRTFEYYQGLLSHLLQFAYEHHWPMETERITTNHIRQFLSWVGTRTGEYITGNGCRRFLKPTPSTPFSYYRAIRRLFNWASENHLIMLNPMSEVHFKTPRQNANLPYSVDEIKTMIVVCLHYVSNGNHFLGLRNLALLLVFIDCATRLQETGSLDVSDLNLTELYIRIIGKGNKLNIVPISSDTCCILKEYLIHRNKRAKTSKLWIQQDGKELTVSGVTSVFRQLKKHASISSPGGVHRIRHFSAISYLRFTGNQFLLQKFFRHEDLATSRRYVQGLQEQEAIAAHRNGGSPVQNLKLFQ